MSVYPPPVTSILSVPTLANSLRVQGWTPIASNPNSLHGTRTTGATNLMVSYRTEHIAAADSASLRLVYANWQTSGIGEYPNTNPIVVRATLEKLSPSGVGTEDQPRIPVTFGGNLIANLSGYSIIVSDPINFGVAAAEHFYVRTCCSVSLPPAPAAPALTPSTTGGSLPTAVTYFVGLTYVYPTGESACSTGTTSTTGAGSTNSIAVTAPTSQAGALGYRVYMTVAGGSGTGVYYLLSGTMPFGNNFTITTAPLNTSPPTSPTLYIPGGSSALGGTNFQGVNNGEGYANSGLEPLYDGMGNFSKQTVSSVYSPMAILGEAPQSGWTPGVAMIGDSISDGTGDAGYANNKGGYVWRAIMRQTALAYSAGQVPKYGFIYVPQSGEQANQYVSLTNSRLRMTMTALASTIISNYGKNDTSFGGATYALNLTTIQTRYKQNGQKFCQCTIAPATNSTDGWTTVTNQTWASVSQEGYRRQMNNWILDTLASNTITAETPFGVYASPTSATNMYGGGNGVATLFITKYPFQTGTEVVTVNGVSKTQAGGDFSYTATATINGVQYAAGITFTVAPGNGLSVLMNYTKLSGFSTLAGGSAWYSSFDTASKVEVNGSNVLTQNGGWWYADQSVAVTSGTSSGSNTSTTLNDTGKAWTANAYKGYTARIITCSGVPAAVGQVRCIAFNTVTQLNFNDAWTNTPDGTATYDVRLVTTQDGVHPSSQGHLMMATAIDLTKVV